MYLASAVLKRFDDEGRQKEDLPLVHWGVQDSLHKAEQALDDLLRNFPNRFIAGAMRFVVFPARPCAYRTVRSSGSPVGQDPAGAFRHPQPSGARPVPDAERT